MDLFEDDVPSPRSNKLSVEEAFAGILLAANAADGYVSQEEVQAFGTLICRMRLYKPLNGDQIGRIIDRNLSQMRRLGLEEFVNRCAAIPDRLRKTAFANAVDMVMADGVVEDEEKQFINNLRRQLNISGDDAQMIVTVMRYKNMR